MNDRGNPLATRLLRAYAPADNMVPPTLPSRALQLGRYALYDEIARGGMATVHYGRLVGPVGFTRIVAIKRMHAQYAGDPDFVQMFIQEARLAARVRHSNVVPTLDVVAMPDETFLVMDYVQGVTLAALQRQSKEREELLPTDVIASIMTGALLGLHAAHETTNGQGELLELVHRDVSPQNLLVGADGVTRVLDFGVAKALGIASNTRDGSLKGKIRYLSPEQVRGGLVTRQADVWAAGVVLWECLANERLFPSSCDVEAISHVLNDAIPEPRRPHGESLPPALVACVKKALAKNTGDRYPDALTMATALRAAVTPAASWDVGHWVMLLAGETIAERAVRIREIEADPSSETDRRSDPTRATIPTPRPNPTTATAVDGVEASDDTLCARLPGGMEVTPDLAHHASPRSRVLVLGILTASLAAVLSLAAFAPPNASLAVAGDAALEAETEAAGAPELASGATATLHARGRLAAVSPPSDVAAVLPPGVDAPLPPAASLGAATAWETNGVGSAAPGPVAAASVLSVRTSPAAFDRRAGAVAPPPRGKAARGSHAPDLYGRH